MAFCPEKHSDDLRITVFLATITEKPGLGFQIGEEPDK